MAVQVGRCAVVNEENRVCSVCVDVENKVSTEVLSKHVYWQKVLSTLEARVKSLSSERAETREVGQEKE